ncbi:hypothetical protein GOB94_09565 [Granulicella sp. 5B5]|nr:hypothetical protein GOB94_09565 [Granulicella sp. 5B5]
MKAHATLESDALPARAHWSVAITSFLFILLQSFCTFAMAVSGVRAVIGVGALAGAVGLIRPIVWFHHDIYRIPMMVLALGGSVLNLYLIQRIRSLRARPSSQWRMAAPTRHQLRSENFQIVLSVITLVLLAVEQIGHFIYHGI